MFQFLKMPIRHTRSESSEQKKNDISIGNYTVREVLMKNRTSVWRNVYNTASA